MENIATHHDTGLRSYLASIYNWMFVGLLVSAFAAFYAQNSGLTETLKHGGALFWVITLVPFALILFMGANSAGAMSVSVGVIAFILFTFLEGLSISVVLSRYTGTSIAVAFLSTSAAFASLSVWAYTTKIDLRGLGTFFLVALVGLLVAMVLSALVHSSVLSYVVNAAGVIIFAGLIAYDTQTMRDSYVEGNADSNARFAIWHALDLYLDFLNLFLFLLRFVGVSSSSSDD